MIYAVVRDHSAPADIRRSQRRRERYDRSNICTASALGRAGQWGQGKQLPAEAKHGDEHHDIRDPRDALVPVDDAISAECHLHQDS